MSSKRNPPIQGFDICPACENAVKIKWDCCNYWLCEECHKKLKKFVRHSDIGSTNS